MAYFIYNKNSENQIYKIAENDTDLASLGIAQDNQYLTINASENDFNIVKLNNAEILNYDNVSNRLSNTSISYSRFSLQLYIDTFKKQINYFLNAQPQSVKYTQWNNYLTYLNSLNVNTIISDPNGSLNSSLETYINNQGQPYFSFLQIP